MDTIIISNNCLNNNIKIINNKFDTQFIKFTVLNYFSLFYFRLFVTLNKLRESATITITITFNYQNGILYSPPTQYINSYR